MSFENKIKELKLELPEAKAPVGSYIATKISGNLLFKANSAADFTSSIIPLPNEQRATNNTTLDDIFISSLFLQSIWSIGLNKFVSTPIVEKYNLAFLLNLDK